MQYSNTTSKSGIVQLCEDLCSLGDGGITNDTTLFLKFTARINQAYRKVSTALLASDKNWKWDDTNYTDFPIATIDLVANQRDYTLPAATSGGNASTLWKINKVEVLQGNGTYQAITLMSPNQAEETTTAIPSQYNLTGNSIRFKELPLASTTAGLRITFQRSIIEFTTASTTVQPGFMDAYHDLLAYDASSTHLMPINMQLALGYQNTFATRLRMLQADYALKNDDSPQRMTPRIELNK